MTDISKLKLTITGGDYNTIYETEDKQRVAAILSMLLNEDAEDEEILEESSPETRAVVTLQKRLEGKTVELEKTTEKLDTRMWEMTNKINKLIDSLKPSEETV